MRREQEAEGGLIEKDYGINYPGWELALKRQELIDEIYAKGSERREESTGG